MFFGSPRASDPGPSGSFSGETRKIITYWKVMKGKSFFKVKVKHLLPLMKLWPPNDTANMADPYEVLLSPENYFLTNVFLESTIEVIELEIVRNVSFFPYC